VSAERPPTKAALAGALLDELSARQAGAVRSDAERLLVLGGAGTGKTEVLARRVAWDVGVRGVARERIVALAFTKRAADELRTRVRACLAQLVGEQGAVAQVVGEQGGSARLVGEQGGSARLVGEQGAAAQVVGEQGGSARLVGEQGAAALPEMFVGTIHEVCFALLRELAPELYGGFQLLDDPACHALAQLYWHGLVGGDVFAYDLAYAGVASGPWHARREFLRCYGLLNEYDQLHVRLPSEAPPPEPEQQVAWCLQARLREPAGERRVARLFGLGAARYYALLRARRVLDYATVQTELLRLLERDPPARRRLAESIDHVALDDAQDLSPVQRKLIAALLGAGLAGSAGEWDGANEGGAEEGGTDEGGADEGGAVGLAGAPWNVKRPRLTVAADPCQAVFGWRGGDGAGLEGLRAALEAPNESEVVELDESWRSTPQIVALANRWWQTTAGGGAGAGARLLRVRSGLVDICPRDVALMSFGTRAEEAQWIAQMIERLLAGEYGDAELQRKGGGCSLRPADVAILLRATHDVEIYGEQLRQHGIPVVFRDAEDLDRSDLFERPLVLLLVGALARLVGIERFDNSEIAACVRSTLPGCRREPGSIVRAAAERLRRDLPTARDLGVRLVLAADLLGAWLLDGEQPAPAQLAKLRSQTTRRLFADESAPDGVPPRTILRGLLEEADIVALLDAQGPAAETALRNLDALEQLVEVLEHPALVAPGGLREQVETLCEWGPGCAFVAPAAALTNPEAVTLATIHTAKGSEWPAVFVADVCVQRFPHRRAQEVQPLPFDGALAQAIDAEDLLDDDYAGERRLMYLALTRAQRCVFVSGSGARRSRLRVELEPLVREVGGVSCEQPDAAPARLAPRAAPRNTAPAGDLPRASRRA
jgi:DNA helicase-2/ATP-dependent DNA helicase PcrA